MIKFTFNVDEAFKKLANANFEEPVVHICKFDNKRLITQKELFDKLPEINSKGLCVLTSIYNAFPNVFKDINELAVFILNEIKNNKPYSSVKYITNRINKIKNSNLLFMEENLKQSFDIFTRNVAENKPIVISYGYNDNIVSYSQHAVTLFGYDDNLIYYKGNSESNYLFASLANYIKEYYSLYGIKKDNPEYERLNEFINGNNSEDELWKLAKCILGYNYIESSGLSTLKKTFLTDNKYFYDINRMITYQGENSCEDNCDSPNKYVFTLTKRLEKINH